MSDGFDYYDVRIGWRDKHGYCDTSRHIATEDCFSALQALQFCQEWSTSCPADSSKWEHCSVVLHRG